MVEGMGYKVIDLWTDVGLDVYRSLSKKIPALWLACRLFNHYDGKVWKR